jgi:hypothetical protein
MIAKSGTYTYPDTTMPVLVLDKNPFDYSKFKKDIKK